MHTQKEGLTSSQDSNLVSQATPFAEREGLVRLQLMTCRHYQTEPLDNEILTSAKHIVTYCYSMTTDAIYEDYGSHWS